jgi:hypothetical protein
MESIVLNRGVAIMRSAGPRGRHRIGITTVVARIDRAVRGRSPALVHARFHLKWVTLTLSRRAWPKQRDEALAAVRQSLDAATAMLTAIQDQENLAELRVRIQQLELLRIRTETAVPLTYPWLEYGGPIGGRL